VQTSARHLLSLINDLLDLAKIEAGKISLDLEDVNCRDLITSVSATVAPLAAAKGLAFDVVLPEGDVVLHTDRRALSQIVLNLASNAIKFTERGGISVVVAHGDGGRGAALQVRDTGVGIDAGDQAKLFEPFLQLEGARRREGSGLGLHLSQKLAALLGGRIEISSEPGKGSCFTVRFEDT
jgi:protein-histidine pros-kinase